MTAETTSQPSTSLQGDGNLFSDNLYKESDCYREYEAVEDTDNVEETQLTSPGGNSTKDFDETGTEVDQDEVRGDANFSADADALTDVDSLAHEYPVDSFQQQSQLFDSLVEQLPVSAAVLEETLPGGSKFETSIPTATQVLRLKRETSDNVRPSLISVGVFKANRETTLGIRFQASNEGHLEVGSISDLLKGCPLQRGDQVLRLNGQNVIAWTISKAVNFLRESVGWVTIVARNTLRADPTQCQTSICKLLPADDLGVSFQPCPSNGALLVSSLSLDGVFGRCPTIGVGDMVQSINRIPCRHADSASADNMIQHAPDWVHIAVQATPLDDRTKSNSSNQEACATIQGEQMVDPNVKTLHKAGTPVTATEVPEALPMQLRQEHVEPALVSVLFHKATKSTRLGLSLCKQKRVLYVTKVSGYLDGTILKPGMQLLAINGQLCLNMSAPEAASILREIVGPICFVARNTHGNPKYAQAMVCRNTSNPPAGADSNGDKGLGISFRGSTGRQLKLCEIKAESFFADSCLNVGDSVQTINGVPCHQYRPREAVEIIKSASSETVTILTRTKSKAAVAVGNFSATRGNSCPGASALAANVVTPRSA